MATKNWLRFSTGDHVTEVDGRHVGRIDHIYGGQASGMNLWAASAVATVRWLETGHVSKLELGELVKVEQPKTRRTTEQKMPTREQEDAARRAWFAYFDSPDNGLPPDIPRRPDIVYKGKGWRSWTDWIGTNK